MLVILRENVSNLGRVGDVVKVADGYARNFLLPRKLGVAADAKNVAAIEHHRKMLDKKRRAQKAVAQEMSAKLGAATVTIAKKVGEGDRIFGSVSSTEIAAGLRALGFDVDRRMIAVDSPIRALGSHTATVRLDAEVEATVKIAVTKSED